MGRIETMCTERGPQKQVSSPESVGYTASKLSEKRKCKNPDCIGLELVMEVRTGSGVRQEKCDACGWYQSPFVRY